jgi:hypothetical protein
MADRIADIMFAAFGLTPALISGHRLGVLAAAGSRGPNRGNN